MAEIVQEGADFIKIVLEDGSAFLEDVGTNAMGAGFADYAIATGIDPFLLDPSDVVLFNFAMALLSDGGDELFLDGLVRGSDIPDFPPLPEPATGLLLGLGLVGLAAGRRRFGTA